MYMHIYIHIYIYVHIHTMVVVYVSRVRILTALVRLWCYFGSHRFHLAYILLIPTYFNIYIYIFFRCSLYSSFFSLRVILFRPEDRLSAFAFDDSRGQLLTASTSQIVFPFRMFLYFVC